MPNSDTAPLLPKSSEKGKGKYYSNSSLSKYSSTPAFGSSSKHAKTTSSSLEYPETVSAGPSSSKNPAASEPEIQEIIDLDLFNAYGYCQSRDMTEAFMEAWASKFHGKAENVACKYREIIKLADTWTKKETKDEEEEKLKVDILEMCDIICRMVGHFLYMGHMARSTGTEEYSDGLEACEGLLSHALPLVKVALKAYEGVRSHASLRVMHKAKQVYKPMHFHTKTIIDELKWYSAIVMQAKAEGKFPKLEGFVPTLIFTGYAPIDLFTWKIQRIFGENRTWKKTR